MSDRTADEIFAIFSRVFGGRTSPFTLHSRTFSGKAVYRRACRSCRSASAGQADCAHCRGGSYRELTAADLINHINGGAAVGIYPADENGLCRFSVLEIGGKAPAMALKALRDTCRAFGADCLCEICGHGESARLWIFFGRGLSPEAAVYAAMRVITEAFSSDINSADVITDLLPTAGPGFGRPVVLPLFDISGGASFLLDGDFEPANDPISMLESFHPNSADFSFPAYRIPTEVKAELCGSLYVNTAGLSPETLTALCRSACFPNPEAAEFSQEPSIARCFSFAGGKLALPRCCDIASLLPGAKLTITDSRAEGVPIRLRTPGELGGWQCGAYSAALSAGGGIMTAPTGSGKTAVFLNLLAHFCRSTLILAPDRAAAAHWNRRIRDISDIDARLIADDRDLPGGLLDIAVLGARTELWLTEYLSSYGVVILADCDRLSCSGAVLRSIMEAVCAKHVYACSARPAKAALKDSLRLYCGKTIYQL